MRKMCAHHSNRNAEILNKLNKKSEDVNGLTTNFRFYIPRKFCK